MMPTMPIMLTMLTTLTTPTNEPIFSNGKIFILCTLALSLLCI